MKQYNPIKIEKKWQKIWQKQNFAFWYAKDFSKKPKRYVLDMFPYPSGEGLHVGHIEGYTASDIYSRYLRMRGFNVLHPMGWDAFGLPAENYAIKTKTHPKITVERNIKRFKKQLQSLGFSYDWQREVNTTDPKYYKWTQWIFLKMFEKGLVYKAETKVNWCPSCKTVLANEEVVDGNCERCGSLVKKRKLKQWLLKITVYAQRLLNDLEKLDWPEPVKKMQREWIGRSCGAEIKFPLAILTRNRRESENTKSREKFINVFTTRADTLFGATYLVLAPEHKIIENLEPKIQNLNEVKKYIEKTKNKSERERAIETKEKTGVELKGLRAINPANGQKISIWIADYVLVHYGTGAVMAVPAHDSRDWDFAKKYKLPIKEVIKPIQRKSSVISHQSSVLENGAYEREGILINSGQFNGMKSEKAREDITKWLAKKGLAKKTITYKLRDWIFSRQRYWGEPIPLVFCENCATRIKNHELRIKNKGMKLNPGWIPISEKDLPLKLPKVEKYQPTGTGESPLAAIDKWVNTKCPRCGGPAKRETNTMPQWAGSCWYYLRYLDPKNNKNFVDLKKEKYWMAPARRSAPSPKLWSVGDLGEGGVDLYLGGAEHAVLHLLYARFWHKFLYDLGLVSTKEPFQKLVNQGLILGADSQRMSKSRGNVINPDMLVKEFGADSLRLYEMFMGPLEDTKPWNPKGIVGMQRFLQRVYKLFMKRESRIMNHENKDFEKKLHQTIKKVTEDIEGFKFNTAISSLMILLNEAEKENFLNSKFYILYSKLLAPFAPHLAEELWQQISQQSTVSIHSQSWPKYDPELAKEHTFELVIQINGKIRDRISVPINISQEEAKKFALNQERIKKILSGQGIKRVIFVPQRLINFVI